MQIQKVPQTAQVVQNVLDHVADRLHIPVAHLWDTLEHQVAVNAMQISIAVAVLVVAFFFALDQRERVHTWAADVYTQSGKEGLVCYYLGLLLLMTAVLTLSGAVIGRLVNPEYYALDSIITVLKY